MDPCQESGRLLFRNFLKIEGTYVRLNNLIMCSLRYDPLKRDVSRLKRNRIVCQKHSRAHLS